jgi:hypothetical protein
VTDPRHQKTPADYLGRPFDADTAGTAIVYIDGRGNITVLHATGSCAAELDNLGRDMGEWGDGDFSGADFESPGPGLWKWTGYIRWNDPGAVEEPEWSCTVQGDFERLPTSVLWALRLGTPDTIAGCPQRSLFT